jgi:hypothetical protein
MTAIILSLIGCLVDDPACHHATPPPQPAIVCQQGATNCPRVATAAAPSSSQALATVGSHH